MSVFLVALASLVVIINAEQPIVPPRGRSFFPEGRIVGGHNASIEEHPHQISLERLGRHTCGGSIISSRYVLTAGHCVGGSDPSQLRVRSGTSLRGRSGSLRAVQRATRHPGYRTTEHGVPLNDVALLRVAEEFVFGPSCRAVRLFQAAEESAPGVRAVISGWGSTGAAGSPVQLQSVAIPIVSKELCNRAYLQFGGLPEGQICAAYYGQGGKDSCQGDSGGPLTIEGRLAGIVSWGNGCAKPYYPGVYTEVAHFRAWIQENAGL